MAKRYMWFVYTMEDDGILTKICTYTKCCTIKWNDEIVYIDNSIVRSRGQKANMKARELASILNKWDDFNLFIL